MQDGRRKEVGVNNMTDESWEVKAENRGVAETRAEPRATAASTFATSRDERSKVRASTWMQPGTSWLPSIGVFRSSLIRIGAVVRQRTQGFSRRKPFR